MSEQSDESISATEEIRKGGLSSSEDDLVSDSEDTSGYKSFNSEDSVVSDTENMIYEMWWWFSGFWGWKIKSL